MQHHMHADPRYQMSLKEVELYLQVAEASGYKFDVTLSGGEPLLWKEINEAAVLIRASKSTARFSMFTNGILHEKLADVAAACFSRIRLSDYGHNSEEVRACKRRWKNAQVAQRYGFWRNPREPVPTEKAHPVKCMNPEVMLYNNRVYACPHCLSISKVLAEPPGAEQLSVPLEPGFMAQMSSLKKTYHADLCTRCISNRRVRDLIKKPDVNVSKDKRPELHQLRGLAQPAKEPWQ